MLINKYFNAYLEVLSIKGKPSFKIEVDEQLSEFLQKELIVMQRKLIEEKNYLPQKYFEKECKNLNITIVSKKR